VVRIGFVGLGTMGAPMAANLVKAGHGVRGFDRAEPARAAAAARGVPVVSDLARAVEGVEAVVTMLPDTPDVEAVLLGPDGIVRHLRPGTVVIDTSSIAPSAAVRLAAGLAERGLAFLDAPVTGGPSGAEAGTLGIMVGGEPEAYARAEPILSAMGRPRRMGPPGSGQATKLCNQIVVAQHLVAVAEAITLARGLGLDPEAVLEVLLGGAARSWLMETFGLRMARDEAAPAFRMALMLKDLRLAQEASFAAGVPLPATALASSLMLAQAAAGEAGLGHHAVIRVFERLAGRMPAAEKGEGR
jgi:2-hydroxy-3-oxopropionate reductase